MTRWSAVPTVAAVAATLAACAFSPSSDAKTVAKQQVQEQISAKVSQQSGTAPESVTCPDDLQAVAGTTLTCAMTRDGKPTKVEVTVTRVDGDEVIFEIYQSVGKDALAEQISDQLAEQVGHAPESVSCPSDLEGDEGATLRCVLQDAGETYGILVTVTDVSGGLVNFDFKVDDLKVDDEAA